MELDRFHLAAGGGERSGPNMLLWLLFSFMLGLCAGGGGYFVMSGRVRNCSHVMGRYVSQQCQMRISCCVKPCAWNSLECSVYAKNLIWGRGLKHNKNYFKILNIFFIQYLYIFIVFFNRKDGKLHIQINVFFISKPFGSDRLQLFHFFFLLLLQNLISARVGLGGTMIFVRMFWISCNLH